MIGYIDFFGVKHVRLNAFMINCNITNYYTLFLCYLVDHAASSRGESKVEIELEI